MMISERDYIDFTSIERIKCALVILREVTPENLPPTERQQFYSATAYLHNVCDRIKKRLYEEKP